MTKKILFVDDEPMVLRGIQRNLRTMRNQWEMEFAGSGPEALETMARGPFDVVVTDMRMPLMKWGATAGTGQDPISADGTHCLVRPIRPRHHPAVDWSHPSVSGEAL